MKYLDRVAEAYEGLAEELMGKQMQEQTRERIDWICAQVQGEFVLDIGCSQGICEVLLARKGLHVTGIDVAEESIAYARNFLEGEELDVKLRVQFICGDFLTVGSLPRQYDTVLMTELLEHLEQPEEMVRKGAQALRDGGTMVVTVPFGINDYPDHKHTFYFAQIYEMLSRYIRVETVEFMGRWIAFCGKKEPGTAAAQSIDIDFIRREEKAFFQLERPLRDQLVKLRKACKKADSDCRQAERRLEEERQAAERRMEQVCEEHLVEIKRLEEEHRDERERFAEELRKAQERMEALSSQLQEDAAELKEEEQFLIATKRQVQMLNAQLQQALEQKKEYEDKLGKIYGTWYGKLVLKVYHALKKIKHMFYR